MKRIYTLFLSLVCFTAVCSFGQTVSNVDAYQEGKNIIITYDTDKAGFADFVFCSTDGGRTWGDPLRQVTGDVNKQVPAGSHRIVWDVLSEREKFEGANICFKVEVNSGKFTVNGVSFEMVRVEGGTFRMGATSEQGSDAYGDEKPVHSVTLSSYYIGKTEVTQALWQAVMGSNPSNFKGADLPVECVSWNDCQEFIQKLNSLTGRNFRLPTEAEWEFACRGGNKSNGYKYSGSNNLGSVAWYDGNSGDKTHPVGTKAPNELGIYDMSGNVWEWCGDWYANYTSNSQTNPKGPQSGSYRVRRGGSWRYFVRCCRSSFRYVCDPADRGYNLGLRLAL
ncbi:MAG: formylglycine-generating enzyme family protein [Bacteroidales bacterium]|nr:formylglycine-generating enzyme family protein [Bacteroidales bacterium]